MAVPKDTISSLLECQCRICVEILIEPVTLPCNHILCKTCFTSTVKKTNLLCLFCQRWIAFWTWYHTQRNSLANMELWEIIQKHYPEECRLRVFGQQSGEIIDDYQPVHLLSTCGIKKRIWRGEKQDGGRVRSHSGGRKQSQWRIYTEITDRGGRIGIERGIKKLQRDGGTTEK